MRFSSWGSGRGHLVVIEGTGGCILDVWLIFLLPVQCLVNFVSEWTAYGKWQKRKEHGAFTKVYGISLTSGPLFSLSSYSLIYFLTTLNRNFEHLVATLKAKQGRNGRRPKSRPLRDFCPSSYEGNHQRA